MPGAQPEHALRLLQQADRERQEQGTASISMRWQSGAQQRAAGAPAPQLRGMQARTPSLTVALLLVLLLLLRRLVLLRGGGGLELVHHTKALTCMGEHSRHSTAQRERQQSAAE